MYSAIFFFNFFSFKSRNQLGKRNIQFGIRVVIISEEIEGFSLNELLFPYSRGWPVTSAKIILDLHILEVEDLDVDLLLNADSRKV